MLEHPLSDHRSIFTTNLQPQPVVPVLDPCSHCSGPFCMIQAVYVALAPTPTPPHTHTQHWTLLFAGGPQRGCQVAVQGRWRQHPACRRRCRCAQRLRPAAGAARHGTAQHSTPSAMPRECCHLRWMCSQPMRPAGSAWAMMMLCDIKLTALCLYCPALPCPGHHVWQEVRQRRRLSALHKHWQHTRGAV